MDAKSVHALGHLIQCALRAYELGNLRQKIVRLERLQNTDSAIPFIDGQESLSSEEDPGTPGETSYSENLSDETQNQVKPDAA